MTIALSLKVNDGIVLAADSASSLVRQDDAGQELVSNIYNNANKIFNLRKGLPIGAMTWGSGAIGNASVETLTKDLRQRLTDGPTGYQDWKIDPDNYQVADVARRTYEFLYEEHYQPAFGDWSTKPDLGFMVVGYSTGASMAEEHIINIIGGTCVGPEMTQPHDETGLSWYGQPEAVQRLLLGFGSDLADVLEENLGVPSDQVGPAVEVIRAHLAAPVLQPAMPFQDAIDLAEFLVHVTVMWSRFMPGAPVVGGPVEVAGITKHEGFKWIHRKHYYDAELNPPLEGV